MRPPALWGPAYCPLRRLTGIPCPLCGTTTAALLTARGHVADAFLTNPLGIVAVAALAWVALRGAGAVVSGRSAVRPTLALPQSIVRRSLLGLALGMCWWIRLHAPARLVDG